MKPATKRLRGGGLLGCFRPHKSRSSVLHSVRPRTHSIGMDLDRSSWICQDLALGDWVQFDMKRDDHGRAQDRTPHDDRGRRSGAKRWGEPDRPSELGDERAEELDVAGSSSRHAVLHNKMTWPDILMVFPFKQEDHVFSLYIISLALSKLCN